jgi:1-acyl-sn-glycerol-3-phosphate acyltransferase
LKYIARFIFWILGWKIDPNPPSNVKKCVVAMGPHTSNWDFILGRLAFFQYGVDAKFLIKKELFFFPLGLFLKFLGGVPVNRKKNSNMTEFAVDLFNKSESMYLVFTPEGTRAYNPHWKKGFYYIALKAKVPIYIGYVDYDKKIGGFHSLFEPTGNIENDFTDIKNILSKFKGRHPEKGIY